MENVRERINDSMTLLNDTIERTRNIMMDLRPAVLDEHGLLAGLKWYGETFSERTGIPVIILGRDLQNHIAKEVERSLFRIFQEVLTNVSKHANATRVDVSLIERENIIILSVQDNGEGFDLGSHESTHRPSLGLVIMKERALSIGATLVIDSKPGRGTLVTITVQKTS